MRKNMGFKALFVVSSILIILSGCDKGGNGANNSGGNNSGNPLPLEDKYFPKYLRNSLYTDKYGYKDTVFFGEQLIFMNVTITNQKKQVYMFVKSEMSGSEGYIYEGNVVKNPMNKGVIFENTSASKKPDLATGQKMEVIAPVLVYVMDTKEQDTTWADVVYYNADYPVVAETKTIPSSYRWVQLNKISMNYEDVKMCVGILDALYEYFGALKNNSSDIKKIAQAKESGKIKLTDLMKAFPASSMIEYANTALNTIEGADTPVDVEGDGGGEVISADEIYGD
ncbi:MAG: hypothetical protein A2014_04155 [Spirochaetes bacterium GWF1_49_6]|nr:MAG: hypothetical protein A2014_04155 [Spirochaetes bacterium GWF1_49_6]